METADLVYELVPTAHIRLKIWDENAVLYHGAAASTYEISNLMATSLQQLDAGSQALTELVDVLCKKYPELNRDECTQHLTEGYRELVTQGVVVKLGK